ncbi:Sec1-like protein [Pluteus cervinus]|uniref:Sec1-like protein n=1 Tax=Pluteus cervinus TaxID=181527 RepID=A0ACD3BH55_9AGAR|nr:Sec1-like protein [Pluteus cervinus]
MSSDDQTNTQQDDSSLDVSILKDIAKKVLVDALNSVNGAKTLVLDSSLAGPLGLVTEVALLKHHGVDKMFWLESGPLTSTTTNIIYLCRPSIKYARIIADHIKKHLKDGKKHLYTLLLVPRKSIMVSRVLEEESVLGEVTILPYNLQFIPIADDVISLECDGAFKQLWADGDESIIYDSAQALDTIQRTYGQFPRIIGKGDYAAGLQRLATLLQRQAASAAAPDAGGVSTQGNIDSLIVLDRRVDMITPLLTQLTYEGLIDELVGIKNSHVELPASLLSPPNPPAASNVAGPSTSPPANPTPLAGLKKETKKKHHLATSTDPLYAELRDLNFGNVGKSLNRVARRLDENYKTNLQSKTVAQLREFVGKIGGLQTEHQALRLHTGLSEMLLPLTRTDAFNRSLEIQQNLLASYDVPAQITAIEDLMAQGTDLNTVLRLLCLASITGNGIKAKVLENIKRDLLQTYGYNYLPLLLFLSAPPLAILLPNPLPSFTPAVVSSLKYPFSGLRKSLRLLIDDTPEALDEVENDISFVYSGYAPISIRLVQCVAQKGGVLSNPAEKEKPANQTNDGQGKGLSGKVQAHPIVGWKGFEDVLVTIPGEAVDIALRGSGESSTISPISSLLRGREQATTTVVFFLGGCTYTEIAALRWVGRQNRGRKFLVATTGIISGNSLMESLKPPTSPATPAAAGL